MPSRSQAALNCSSAAGSPLMMGVEACRSWRCSASHSRVAGVGSRSAPSSTDAMAPVPRRSLSA